MVIPYCKKRLSQELGVRRSTCQRCHYKSSRAFNRVWIDESGNTFQVLGGALTANAITAAQDLAADHPLIVGSMNHAMVLIGERYWVDLLGKSQFLSATVCDPGPGRGERNLTPQEWSNIQFAIRIRVF
jgi:hypothetical protein